VSLRIVATLTVPRRILHARRLGRAASYAVDGRGASAVSEPAGSEVEALLGFRPMRRRQYLGEHRRAVPIALLAALLGGCGEPETRSTAPALELEARADEPGATRASREAAREEDGRELPSAAPPAHAPIDSLGAGAGAAPSAAAPPPATPSATRPAGAGVTLRAISTDVGEDGHGGTIAARDPIALDLDARRFPPRALDPVLTVGSLRLARYRHPRPGVLRFVLADRALLSPGAVASVQYGDDGSSRTIVSSGIDPSQILDEDAP
jgi:hypothetical protein